MEKVCEATKELETFQKAKETNIGRNDIEETGDCSSRIVNEVKDGNFVRFQKVQKAKEEFQKAKEESSNMDSNEIEETGDCSRNEVENLESGIWEEVKNARVHFCWGDFFYSLFLGLGPTVCFKLS